MKENNTKRKPAIDYFPQSLAATIREPKNVQLKHWQLCCKSQFNALLSEKMRRIKAEHSHGEQMLVKKLLIAWARDVRLFEHFPGVSEKLCPEIPYYLDYCERVNKQPTDHTRGYVVAIARAILTRDIQKIAVIYANWQSGCAENEIRKRLRLTGTAFSNITFHILRGNSEKALAIFAESLSATTTNEGSEIADLERRLSHLKEHGDITDETQRFQLEQKIHGLKNKLDDEEWPDVIGEGGEL